MKEEKECNFIMKYEYKISVIVPVYNVENYIVNSLNSLVNQTIFEDLEIILIDDGSTDNSIKLCHSLINKYSNIKLFVQKNSGVSAARNTGLENANGEFIVFFDADDYAEPILYESLYSLVENTTNSIGMVDYCFVNPDGSSQKKRNNIQTVYNGEEILKKFLMGQGIENVLVDKIFPRTCIKNLKFDEKYSIGEDMFFVYQTLKVIDRLIIDTSINGYQYLYRPNSAMNSKFSSKFLDPVILSERIVNLEQGELYFYAEAHLIHEQCKLITLIELKKAEKYKSQQQMYFNKIKKYEFSKAYKYLTKKRFLIWLLLSNYPNLYFKLYKKIKKRI